MKRKFYQWDVKERMFDELIFFFRKTVDFEFCPMRLCKEKLFVVHGAKNVSDKHTFFDVSLIEWYYNDNRRLVEASKKENKTKRERNQTDRWHLISISCAFFWKYIILAFAILFIFNLDITNCFLLSYYYCYCCWCCCGCCLCCIVPLVKRQREKQNDCPFRQLKRM